MEEYYTTKDVAALLKIKTATVRKYIRQKKLAAVRLDSGEYRISKEQLDKYLELRHTIVPN